MGRRQNLCVGWFVFLRSEPINSKVKTGQEKEKKQHGDGVRLNLSFFWKETDQSLLRWREGKKV